MYIYIIYFINIYSETIIERMKSEWVEKVIISQTNPTTLCLYSFSLYVQDYYFFLFFVGVTQQLFFAFCSASNTNNNIAYFHPLTFHILCLLNWNRIRKRKKFLNSIRKKSAETKQQQKYHTSWHLQHCIREGCRKRSSHSHQFFFVLLLLLLFGSLHWIFIFIYLRSINAFYRFFFMFSINFVCRWKKKNRIDKDNTHPYTK